MADKVVQEFVADDANYRRSLENQVRDTIRAQNANEKRATQSKQAAQDEIRNWKGVGAAIDEAVRKHREWQKAQRGMLTPANNFVFSSRNGGPLANTPNFVRQQTPLGGYLGHSGGEPRVAGYLGYDGQPSGHLGRWAEALNARRAQQHLNQVGQQLAGFGGNFLHGAMQMAAGFLAAESAVRAFNRVLEIAIERENRSSDASSNLARGHAVIALNTFGQTEADRARFRTAAKDISGRGLPEGMVAELIGEQAGRGANLSPDQIIDAADVAAQLTRHTPEQFRPTAAGIQQIMRIGKVGSKQAASLFQSAAAAAYPGNPELQARMVQQSIASGIANSPTQDLETVEQIAEYASAASQVGGEERGEAVRTAIVALIAQQREFSEGRGPWERSGPFGMKMHPKVPSVANMRPREFFEHLNTHQDLQSRFWDKANFERQYEGVLRDMLTNPGGKSGEILSETQKLVGINVPALDEQIRAVAEGSPQLKTASEGQVFNAVQQQDWARDQISAKTKILRENRDSAMLFTAKARGYGNSVWDDFRFAISDRTSPTEMEDRLIGSLYSRRAAIQNASPFDRMFGESDKSRAEAISYLDRMIKKMEEVRVEINQLRSEPPQPTGANEEARGGGVR